MYLTHAIHKGSEESENEHPLLSRSNSKAERELAESCLKSYSTSLVPVAGEVQALDQGVKTGIPTRMMPDPIVLPLLAHKDFVHDFHVAFPLHKLWAHNSVST